MLAWVLWKGILLGLGAAVPIGPVNVEIARRTLRGGFRSGFLLGCGAVTVDVAYAVLVTFSIRPLLDRPWAMTALGITGAAILGHLGVMCLRSAWRQKDMDLAGDDPGRPRRNYITGLAMTATNPMTLAFWFVVVPGIAGQLSANPARDLPLICAGVFVGAFSWVCFFAGFIALVAIAGQRRRRRLLMVADAGGGLLLLGFALLAIWRSLPLHL